MNENSPTPPTELIQDCNKLLNEIETALEPILLPKPNNDRPEIIGTSPIAAELIRLRNRIADLRIRVHL